LVGRTAKTSRENVDRLEWLFESIQQTCQVQPRLDVLRFQLKQLTVRTYGGIRPWPQRQFVSLLQTALGGASVARGELRVGSQEPRV
jgi:hypothetical protein